MEENWKIISNSLWKIAVVAILGLAVGSLKQGRSSGLSSLDLENISRKQKGLPELPPPPPESLFDFKILAAVVVATFVVGWLAFYIFKKWKRRRDIAAARRGGDAALILQAENWLARGDFERCAATLADAVFSENQGLALELEDLAKEFAQLKLLKSGHVEADFLKMEQVLVARLSKFFT